MHIVGSFRVADHLNGWLRLQSVAHCAVCFHIQNHSEWITVLRWFSAFALSSEFNEITLHLVRSKQASKIETASPEKKGPIRAWPHITVRTYLVVFNGITIHLVRSSVVGIKAGFHYRETNSQSWKKVQLEQIPMQTKEHIWYSSVKSLSTSSKLVLRVSRPESAYMLPFLEKVLSEQDPIRSYDRIWYGVHDKGSWQLSKNTTPYLVKSCTESKHASKVHRTADQVY